MDTVMFCRELHQKFDLVGDVVEDMVVVGNDEEFFHYNMRTRKPAYEARFNMATHFSEGLAGVAAGDDYFHIKKDGTPAYPQRYKDVGSFNDEGLAWVCQRFDAPIVHEDDFPEQYLWAQINKQGLVVTPWQKRF